jgi:enoyl-CoA hydratase/carnithine racemase
MQETRIVVPETLSGASLGQLRMDLSTAMNDSSRVVVLLGEEGTFCRGLDFEYLLRAAYKDFVPTVQDLMECYLLIRHAPKQVVAVVQGKVRGAGLGLLAAADFVIAAEGTEFGLPEALFGLDPAIVLPFLQERISPQRARYLALSAHAWSVREALDAGLIDRVALAEDIRKEVRGAVRRLSLANPASVARIKKHSERGSEPMRPMVEAAAEETLATIRDPHVRERIRLYMVEGVTPWKSPG